MAEAVVFALIASFVLSRTLVPTLAKYLLQPHVDPHAATRIRSPTRCEKIPPSICRAVSLLSRFQRGFERRFENVRDNLSRTAGDGAGVPARSLLGFLAVVVLLSFAARAVARARISSRASTAGQIKLHMRAQTGTRIEETARLATQVEKTIRRMIPADELKQRRRQHRPAGQRHQYHLQQFRADRSGRCAIS